MTSVTPDLTKIFADAQKQALASLEQAQTLSIRAAEAAVSLMPTEPWTGFSNGVRSASELVESTFGFAGQVLESQKAYALRLAGIVEHAAETNGGAKKAAQ